MVNIDAILMIRTRSDTHEADKALRHCRRSHRVLLTSGTYIATFANRLNVEMTLASTSLLVRLIPSCTYRQHDGSFYEALRRTMGRIMISGRA